METPPSPGDLPPNPEATPSNPETTPPNTEVPPPNPEAPLPNSEAPPPPPDAAPPIPEATPASPDAATGDPQHEEPHAEEPHPESWQDSIRAMPAAVKWAAVSLPVLLLLLWWLFAGSSATSAPAQTFVIAMDPTWYPLQLMGREKQMSGFCEELLRTIAQESKIEIHLVTNAPQRMLPDLENGHYDGILSSQPSSYFPNGQYLFSRSIYRIGPVLVVKEESKVTSLADLGGRIVAVVGDNLIITQIDDYPTIIFNSYPTSSAALADLDEGKIDGVIIKALQGNTLLLGYYAGKFKVASAPLTKDALRLVLHKDPQAEDFIAVFDKELKKLKQEGIYSNLIKNWDLINTDPD